MLVKNVKSRRGALRSVDIVGSFNGRTGAFEASDDGSTPSPTTTRLKCGGKRVSLCGTLVLFSGARGVCATWPQPPT